MEVIKKIAIVAVLVASSAMFSFANGQVEGLSDEGYQYTETEAERAERAEREERYNQHVKRLEELGYLRIEACSEAETMIEKRRKLLLKQESLYEPRTERFTMHAQILTAWVTYYQTFCKD